MAKSLNTNVSLYSLVFFGEQSSSLIVVDGNHNKLTHTEVCFLFIAGFEALKKIRFFEGPGKTCRARDGEDKTWKS